MIGRDAESSRYLSGKHDKENKIMRWNSNLYDDSHRFVSQYGSEVVELLASKAGEEILDLGCGTGDLAMELKKIGGKITGIDASAEMIRKAKAKYPEIPFYQGDATGFELDNRFDAVFSNATLHWIPAEHHPKVLNEIKTHLKSDGRLVAEMGGAENVKTVRTAVQESLLEMGLPERAQRQIWYFPKAEDYRQILEKSGFKVDFLKIIDRPTKLEGKEGLQNWLKMFGDKWFKGLQTNVIQKVLAKTQEKLKPTIFKDGDWIADYKRLRFKAYLGE